MVTVSSRYGHDQLKVWLRSAQGTVTVSSRYGQVQIDVQSRTDRGTITVSLSYYRGQLNVRSSSGRGTVTVSLIYCHGQVKLGQGQFEVRSRSDRGRSRWAKGTVRSDRGTVTARSWCGHRRLKCRSVLNKLRSADYWSYLAQFFLEWEMFETKVVEKIKTHILRSIIFLLENRAVYKIMWKNIVKRVRPQTMTHAHCMLDT